MTKPSYEERVARWKKAARSYRSDMLTALGNWRINRERAEAAETELLRVRGLLYAVRLRIGTTLSAATKVRSDEWREVAEHCLKVLKAASESSQGAESADIGKLDTADKSACTFCGKPRTDELHNAGAELLTCSSFTADDYHKFVGSAETGGEKA